MTRTLTVAEMAVRELARRRTVLAMLALMPLAFYLSRRGGHVGQSIRFVCLGLGWTLSTAALFAGGSARSMEPRLRLSGYATRHLCLGRLVALWAMGAVLSVPFFVLVRFDLDEVRYAAIAGIMALTVAVAAPFGLLLAALLPRELEGALLLLTIVGLQMMVDPANEVSRLLPFWFSREIATYAVDHTDADYLQRGLVHGGAVLLALVAALVATSGWRLRRRSHVRLA